MFLLFSRFVWLLVCCCSVDCSCACLIFNSVVSEVLTPQPNRVVLLTELDIGQFISKICFSFNQQDNILCSVEAHQLQIDLNESEGLRKLDAVKR